MQRPFLVSVCLGAVLAFGAPLSASAGPCADPDGDGVCSQFDNCTLLPNATQTDTDGDFCGNRCDADFDQSGTVSIADFSSLVLAFGGPGIPPGLQDIGEDPPSGTIAIADFSVYTLFFSLRAGPSGTTPGTVQCP